MGRPVLWGYRRGDWCAAFRSAYTARIAELSPALWLTGDPWARVALDEEFRER